MIKEKERDLAVDLLKFMAAILVVNSHLDVCYVNYSFLATGGAIGDCLFFFCSGYTLYLKDFSGWKGFPNWYKRRINRIYPSIIAIFIFLYFTIGDKSDIISIIFPERYWFVECILIYYVLIYFVGLYFKEKIKYVFVVVSLLSILLYWNLDKSEGYNMYESGGLYRWVPFSLFIFLGAYMGEKVKKLKRQTNINQTIRNTQRDLCYSLLFLCFFYVIYIMSRNHGQFLEFQVFNIFPLFGGVYFLYNFASSKRIVLYIKKYYFPIRLIGGLCLEIYLVNHYVITDRLNFLFPLNLFIVFFLIVICAYFVRCLARFISQTFKDEPYNFKEMISFY